MSIVDILNSVLSNETWTLAEVYGWSFWGTVFSALVLAALAIVALLIVIYIFDSIAQKAWNTETVWSRDKVSLPILLCILCGTAVLTVSSMQVSFAHHEATEQNIAENIEATNVHHIKHGGARLPDRVETVLSFDETGERLFQEFVYSEQHELMIPLDTPEKLEFSVIEGSDLDQVINKTSNSAE